MRRIYFLIALFFSLASAADVCYGELKTEGACIGGGICSEGFECKKIIPIKNLSDFELDNVKIYYKEAKLGASIDNKCGLEPDNGTCEVSANVNFGDLGILDKAVKYTLFSGLLPKEEIDVWFKNTVEVSCFGNDDFYIEYEKNGNIYREKIPSCANVVESETESNTVTPVCGVFENMFQTLNNDCSNSGGTIVFTNAGDTIDGTNNIIINPSDKILNTCVLETSNWILNQYNTCGEKGDCVKSVDPKALNVNVLFANPPQNAQIDDKPVSFAYDKIIDGNVLYDGYKYNSISENGAKASLKINFEITSSLKINYLKITKNNYVLFNSPNTYDLDIGYLTYNSDGSQNSVVVDNAQNVSIYELNLKYGSNINISANNSIKMNTFNVGSSQSSVILKAPFININSFNIKNDGDTSKPAHVVLMADEIDIGDLNLGENVYLSIVPYSKEKVLFKCNKLDESSSSTVLLQSGDYYLREWALPGTSNVMAVRAYDENSKVNIFLDNSLIIGNNPSINANAKKDFNESLKASNFIIYINGDLNTGGGGTTINAGIIAFGDAVFGNPTYIKGAVAAQNISIGQGQFIYDGDFYHSQWGVCDGENTQNGYFNVVETSFNASEDPLEDENSTLNDIHTKVANSDFDVKILSLDNDKKTLKNFSGLVELELINTPQDENECIDAQTLGEPVFVAFNNESSKNVTLNYPFAAKDVSFRIKASSLTIPQSCNETYEHGKYQNHGKNKSVKECINDLEALDIGYDEKQCIYECQMMGKGEGGKGHTYRYRHHFHGGVKCVLECLQSTSAASCSRDNFAIRPEKFVIDDVNSVIKAGVYFTIPVRVESETGLDFDDVIYVKASDLNNCYDGNISLKDSQISFKNSESNISMAYSDAGEINITVSEVNGSEFAKVDAKDTPWEIRKIGDGNATVKKFVPHHFEVDANLYNFNGGNFVYISNNLAMSAMLKLNISAKNEANDSIKNYVNGCYARNVELNITYPSLDVANIGFTPNNYINYELKETSDKNSSVINDDMVLEINKSVFTQSTNTLNIAINFDKNYSAPLNEFNFSVSKIYLKDVDGVQGSGSANGEAIFRYGRVKIPDLSSYYPEVNGSVEYQYWKDGWQVNKEHVSEDFGKIISYTPSQSSDGIKITFYAINSGVQKISVENVNNKFPATVKKHYDIDSWLWYHPLATEYKAPSVIENCVFQPCSKVSFLRNESGWGGIEGVGAEKFKEENRSLNVSTTTTELNASKKELKTINW